MVLHSSIMALFCLPYSHPPPPVCPQKPSATERPHSPGSFLLILLWCTLHTQRPSCHTKLKIFEARSHIYHLSVYPHQLKCNCLTCSFGGLSENIICVLWTRVSLYGSSSQMCFSVSDPTAVPPNALRLESASVFDLGILCMPCMARVSH